MSELLKFLLVCLIVFGTPAVIAWGVLCWIRLLANRPEPEQDNPDPHDTEQNDPDEHSPEFEPPAPTAAVPLRPSRPAQDYTALSPTTTNKPDRHDDLEDVSKRKQSKVATSRNSELELKIYQ